MAVSDTLLNTLFDGRYRIVRKLGTGGMANVYLAEDEVLGRRVAIKILNDRHAGDDQFVERFRREAKNAASLSHPNIVSIYDRGEAEGTYYIAMEYLDGRSLKELIVARGPAPVNVAIDYARQILAAIRFAHRHGIVHRDIKPHNVLVDTEGRLKVTDFGIARAGTSQMTEAGSIIGTAQYLSPEQAKGAPVDQTSDLYSVGVVLYELLTGVVPFSGDTPVEIAMKHLSSTPEAPSAKRSEIPRDLDMIVMRALAKDPADRYQSAEEMDADLARVARGAAVSPATEEAATAIISRPPPTAVTAITPPRTREPVPYAPPAAYYDYDEPRRRAVWPWIVALLFVAAAIIGGYFLYNQVQSQLNSKVAVENYLQLREIDAVKKIGDSGLRVQVVRQYNAKVEKTFVFRQDPQPGERIDKGNYVTIYTSQGPPLTDVPNVVGKRVDEALADLRQANLRWKVQRVDNNAPVDQVISQRPSGGQAQQDSVVVLRVSKGPKPVIVPSVVGSTFDSANSALMGAGFAVRRKDVESDQPKNTVVDQSPAGGTYQPPGATITLSVSKGPTTSTVPDVTSLAQADAVAQLRASGFRVRIVSQPVTDPNQDGIVQTQDPAGSAKAPPGSTVTIAVGKFGGDTNPSPGPP
ncbi:MAG TPA: Stk1 family PASTA domain-containing Ser/Thr kinase [Gaiellaceae bacterium]|jgi:serine/threonine-protein kinase|nr:Stk1 family PASTA domain-containing Ser/Thr kinase [Gaiellaceae bacterium]